MVKILSTWLLNDPLPYFDMHITVHAGGHTGGGAFNNSVDKMRGEGVVKYP